MGCGAGHGTAYYASEVVSLRDGEVADSLSGKAKVQSQSAQSSQPRLSLASAEVAEAEEARHRRLVQELRGSTLPACRRLGVELKGMLDNTSGINFLGACCDVSDSAATMPFAVPRSAEALLEWDAYLHGPADTPYAGGIFRLALEFPDAYPLKPPKVGFVTPCYHPNVSAEKGEICLNVLKADWSPMLTVSALLLCISALLSQPAPEDPLNNTAAELLLTCPEEFERMAREWTWRYACGKAAVVGRRARSS
mmetsp:Transcript_4566/g.9411  ORF Transcript_4566/g.9411 Transcript_4566/m.9411 type:complete len:252 (-) Transcript_4566:1-756(-)